jgi:ApbE superfamily uncharacterized protein (UPF0280 family)
LRHYEKFSWKGANFLICTACPDIVKEEIKKQRKILETYILRHPRFGSSFTPVSLLPGAPEIARRMALASEKTGVGPMAAVAGVMAQAAVEAARKKGDRDIVVENGGDIYMASESEVVVGLFAGKGRLSDELAVSIPPGSMPLSVCSSSSLMGHSVSLGRCDLACVTSKDAALADAAATSACNLVKSAADVKPCLETIMNIDGILGILVVFEDRVGLAGDFPALIRNEDKRAIGKITFSQS